MRKFIFITYLIFQVPVLFGQGFTDYTKVQLVDDIYFLFDQLSQVHPNANVVDLIEVEEIISNLKADHYSEIDVFFVINGFLKKLNDGHSNVKFSAERTKNIIKYGEFFPYELAFFDSTAVVIGTINGLNKDILRREIFKINNVPIKKILSNLAVVAMMDGESNNSEAEWLAEDFWFYFSLYNGFRNSYSITYLENGREFHALTKAVSRSEFLKSSILDEFKSQPIELSYIAEVPVLKVSNFEQKGSVYWKVHLNKIFKELNENSASQLVLDLRENGGGQENLQNILLEAFGIDPRTKYEFEGIKKVNLKEVKGVLRRPLESLESFGLNSFTFTKNKGDVFRVKPQKKSNGNQKAKFDGELFVLIDGTTFSCASDAAAILDHQYKNVSLVGTETRGSGKVNYAGYFMHIELPHSRLEIRIPRVKYILNTSSCSEDSGVIPDFYVEMNKADMQSNVDSQLSFIIQHLREREAANP